MLLPSPRRKAQHGTRHSLLWAGGALLLAALAAAPRAAAQQQQQPAMTTQWSIGFELPRPLCTVQYCSSDDGLFMELGPAPSAVEWSSAGVGVGGSRAMAVTVAAPSASQFQVQVSQSGVGGAGTCMCAHLEAI